MLPTRLACAAHHEQVARRRCNVERRPATLRPDQERAPGPECDDGDERVVELAQLAIGVRRDAVVAVAVVVETDRSRTALRSASRARRGSSRRPGGGADPRRGTSTTGAGRRPFGPTCDAGPVASRRVRPTRRAARRRRAASSAPRRPTTARRAPPARRGPHGRPRPRRTRTGTAGAGPRIRG